MSEEVEEVKVYHKSEVINAFSDLLKYAVDLKRNSVIPHTRFTDSGNEPQKAGSRYNYYFSDIGITMPACVEGTPNEYPVAVRPHTHIIDPLVNDETQKNSDTHTRYYGQGSGTTIIGPDTKTKSKQINGVEIPEGIVVSEGDNSIYTPPSIRTENVTGSTQETFRKIPFSVNGETSVEYYNSFSKFITFLEKPNSAGKNVFVYVDNEEDAGESPNNGINTKNTGLLGTYNGTYTPPNIVLHSHTVPFSYASYERKNWPLSSYKTRRHLGGSETPRQSYINSDILSNRWWLPDGSLGFVKIQSEVSEEVPDKLDMEEMKNLVDLIDFKTSTDSSNMTDDEINKYLNQIKRTWKESYIHDEAMFAAVARWIYKNTKVLRFTVGTIAIGIELENDPRFVPLTKFTMLHCGQRDKDANGTEYIRTYKEAGKENKEELRFEHGNAVHTHNWNRKETNDGLKHNTGDGQTRSLYNGGVLEKKSESYSYKPDGYSDDYTTAWKIGDSSKRNLFVYDPKREKDWE